MSTPRSAATTACLVSQRLATPRQISRCSRAGPGLADTLVAAIDLSAVPAGEQPVPVRDQFDRLVHQVSGWDRAGPVGTTVLRCGRVHGEGARESDVSRIPLLVLRQAIGLQEIGQHLQGQTFTAWLEVREQRLRIPVGLEVEPGNPAVKAIAVRIERRWLLALLPDGRVEKIGRPPSSRLTWPRLWRN